jgi:8-oxo-dGTP pyrophosphatase MutT (NUDIX family)
MTFLTRITENLRKNVPQSLPFNFPEAAVLLMLTDDERNPEIVFTRRAAHLHQHSGQVAFPGGKKDASDATLFDTAMREAQEEVGLSPEKAIRIGSLNQVISKHNILVSPFVVIVPHEIQLAPNPDEIESIFRVPATWFLDAKAHRVDKLSFRSFSLNVPCYLFEDYEIWGMSAIVLVDFLNVALNADICL